MTIDDEMSQDTRLPKAFEDEDSEIRFWDETDLTTLNRDELREVGVERKRSRKTTFAIRLDQEAVERLRIIARLRGIGPTQLVREWVMQHLGELSRGQAVSRGPIDESIRAAAISRLIQDVPAIVEDVLGPSDVPALKDEA